MGTIQHMKDLFERDKLSDSEVGNLSVIIGLWNENTEQNCIALPGYVNMPYSNKNKHSKR
mgnify:CR=1 FL=1